MRPSSQGDALSLRAPVPLASGLLARIAAIATAALTACASGPPAPEWQSTARSALDRAVAAYFAGNARTEAQEVALVREELARTGRPGLLGRAELIRCAARVASLVFEPCAGFTAYAADAGEEERSYAAFLEGRATPSDIAQLPRVQRSVAAAAPGAAAIGAMAAIKDPLSRLVAAAVLLQTRRAGPGIVAGAVETASSQGWRRPLLAWLGVQLRAAEAAADSSEAERIQRRIRVVEEASRVSAP